jgi:hypothetical protein
MGPATKAPATTAAETMLLEARNDKGLWQLQGCRRGSVTLE